MACAGPRGVILLLQQVRSGEGEGECGGEEEGQVRRAMHFSATRASQPANACCAAINAELFLENLLSTLPHLTPCWTVSCVATAMAASDRGMLGWLVAFSARADLERYLHYYTRFTNHHNSLKLEVEAKGKMEQKIKEMEQLGDNTWMDCQYLNDANEALYECRYALQYTYVYAFYLPKKQTHRHHFEMQQTELERQTEDVRRATLSPSAPQPARTRVSAGAAPWPSSVCR
eukprot:3397810-Pleurochrysis_carterae.AAC.5